jgi:CubicO group peptidase (beta-lactamase class C family)
MTSGFECDDHRSESFQCEKTMYKAKDWVNFALNLPMAHQPGDHWAYNSTSLILVSEIIAQATGLSVPLFADKNLMEPLGITGYRWGFSPKGRAWLGGNASMRPRDMAKFGQMCLNKGLWQNRRIVSEAWLAESTRCHSYSEYGMEYGYLWWRGRQTINGRPIEGFWAQGNGGQVIFVCPKVDLVAVFTGGNYNSMLELQFMGMLINHILPAMLPPKPEKTFITPDKQVMAKLPGAYRCNQLHLDLSVEGDGLAGRLAGQKAPFFLKATTGFSYPIRYSAT